MYYVYIGDSVVLATQNHWYAQYMADVYRGQGHANVHVERDFGC